MTLVCVWLEGLLTFGGSTAVEFFMFISAPAFWDYSLGLLCYR